MPPTRRCRRATASPSSPTCRAAPAARTQATNTTFEAKYRKVYALLQNDAELRGKIKQAAAAYGIDPMHIVGAIVGEHTYNVDAYDRLQTYYVKAISYLRAELSFAYDGEDIDDFVQRPEFAACAGESRQLRSVGLPRAGVEPVLPRQERGRQSFPNDRFSATFFQPFYAGQTFGLGQLNPLTALQMSDLVHKVSGPADSSTSAIRNGVYKTIMDPDLTLALCRGDAEEVDRRLQDRSPASTSRRIPASPRRSTMSAIPKRAPMRSRPRTTSAAAAGSSRKLPEENYYGWLVNDKLPELQALF